MKEQKIITSLMLASLVLSQGGIVLADELQGENAAITTTATEPAIENVDGLDSVDIEEPIEQPKDEPKQEDPLEEDPVEIPDTPIEQPKDEPKQDTPVEQPKDEPKQDAPIEQPIVNPIEQPVVIGGGQIINTQDGNLIVQGSDGTVNVVTPDSVGGKLEADGTIVLKDKEGKMTRLPNTNSELAGSILMTIFGFLSLVGAGISKMKGLI